MALNYQKTNWVNNETKLNPANMNKIEDGIKNASDKIDNLVVQTIGDSTTAVMSQNTTTDELIKTHRDISELATSANSRFYDIEWVQGVYGSSGYSEILNYCVCLPISLYNKDRIKVYPNGARIKCFLVSKKGESTLFENLTIVQQINLDWATDIVDVIVPDTSGLYLIVDVNLNSVTPQNIPVQIYRSVFNSSEDIVFFDSGKGIMRTDSNGDFVVDPASSWRLYSTPVKEGIEYNVALCKFNYTSGGKYLWAFTSLDYRNISASTLTADNVLSTSSLFTETGPQKPIVETITAPSGAKSLVLCCYTGTIGLANYNCFSVKCDDEYGREITTKTAVNFTQDDVVKGANLAYGITVTDNVVELTGGKAYCLATIIKTRKNTENIIIKMTSKIEKTDESTNYPYLCGIFDNHYESTRYSLDNSEFMDNSWRFPAFGFVNKALSIYINIPDNTTLYIKNVECSYSSAIMSHETGIRQSGHLGAYGFAPENTMQSFIAAHNLGYPSCIANPKITNDGVFVCIHDDDISRTALDAEGNEVPTGTVLVSNTNYTDLLQYDFGKKYNEVYAGAKIPKLDDFLFLCGRVGMKPIFSCHSNFTIDQWNEMKKMMVRYGILNGFTCKGGSIVILESAYSVFGNEIDGYVFDLSTSDVDSTINALNDSSLYNIKNKVYIEVASSVITEEIIEKIISAGYKAGVFDVFGMEGKTYKKLIRHGVTEFVDDKNYSFGLNW